MNQTRQTLVAEHVHTADHFFSRLRGLMWTQTFPPRFQALLIAPCNAIHTFFMRYPIDVVFLSKDGHVLHTVEAMSPWRMSKRVSQAKRVLELPAYALQTSQTEINDQVIFQS